MTVLPTATDEITGPDLDWQEAFAYRAGTLVELRARPGRLAVVSAYEAMLVPPIWLHGDPMPRYAHELRIVTYPPVCELAAPPLLTRGHRRD